MKDGLFWLLVVGLLQLSYGSVMNKTGSAIMGATVCYIAVDQLRARREDAWRKQDALYRRWREEKS